MEEDIAFIDYFPFQKETTDKYRYVVDINFCSDELWARGIESWVSFYIFDDSRLAFHFLFTFLERMGKRNKYELEELFSDDTGLVYGALYKNGDKSVRIWLGYEPVNDCYYREFRYKGKTGGKLRFV